MGFKEKDTLIIVLCCMLFVLLIIFFLSERKKYILNNFETSVEGEFQEYSLNVKKYIIQSGSNNNNRNTLERERTLSMDRILLFLGDDRKGTMYVKVHAPGDSRTKSYLRKTVDKVDISNQFLPEGSCNLDFFDSDLINFRGERVRKGEKWKYMRNISLYGENEKNVEVHYEFLGKKTIEDSECGLISFSIPDKTWLEKGLHTISNLNGYFIVSEEAGRVLSFECSYNREDEENRYFYKIGLTLDSSGVLSSTDLARFRRDIDDPSFFQAETFLKKSMFRMEAAGTREEIDRELFTAKRQQIKLYTVQVRKLADRGEAIFLSRKLKQKGYETYIIKKGSVFSVCVGKYPKGSSDLAGLHAVLKQFFPEASIIHPDSKSFIRFSN